MPDFSAMPEAFVSNASLAAAVSREVKAGTLRKLASRLYTRNLKDPPDQVVKRNLWPLVAAYLPGALIADRTALENRPAPDAPGIAGSPGTRRGLALRSAAARPVAAASRRVGRHRASDAVGARNRWPGPAIF